jgi:cell division protein FtsA
LVDFGAETTTISVYTNNILRKLIVIPLGANNITMDIAKCLKIEHDEAETIKLKYGRAFLDNQESAQYNKIQLSRGREISESCLCEIIEARCEEIIRNIWKQIAEENSKLISGIVFTGGGAQLRQLAEAFQKITYEAQIRIVKVLPSDISLASGVKIIDFNRTYTLLSLLLHGNQNCVIHNVPTEAPDNTPIEDPTPNPPVPDTPDKEKEDNPEEENPEPKKTRIGLWGIIKKALTEEEDN